MSGFVVDSVVVALLVLFVNNSFAAWFVLSPSVVFVCYFALFVSCLLVAYTVCHGVSCVI